MPQDGLRSRGARRGRGTRPGSVYIKCSEDEEEKETKKEWLVRSEWNQRVFGKPNKGSSLKRSNGPSVSDPAERSGKMSSEK